MSTMQNESAVGEVGDAARILSTLQEVFECVLDDDGKVESEVESEVDSEDEREDEREDDREEDSSSMDEAENDDYQEHTHGYFPRPGAYTVSREEETARLFYLRLENDDVDDTMHGYTSENDSDEGQGDNMHGNALADGTGAGKDCDQMDFQYNLRHYVYTYLYYQHGIDSTIVRREDVYHFDDIYSECIQCSLYCTKKVCFCGRNYCGWTMAAKEVSSKVLQKHFALCSGWCTPEKCDRGKEEWAFCGGAKH